MSDTALRFSFRLRGLSQRQVDALKLSYPGLSYRPYVRDESKFATYVSVEDPDDYTWVEDLARQFELEDENCDFFFSAAMSRTPCAVWVPDHVVSLVRRMGVGDIALSFTFLAPTEEEDPRGDSQGLDCLLEYSFRFFRLSKEGVERVRHFWPEAFVWESKTLPGRYFVDVELREGLDYSWIKEVSKELEVDDKDLKFVFAVETEYDSRIYDVPMYVVRLVREIDVGGSCIRFGWSELPASPAAS